MPTKKPSTPKQYSYAQACKTWSISDHWPLDDAVNLVLGLLPRIVQTGCMKPEIARRHKILREIALNCTGESLSVINPEAPEDQYRVRPREFVRWAEKITAVPQELKEIIDKADTHLGKKDAPREWSPKQRRRERCRGIAALIWSQQPGLTKGQVADQPEILEHGCQGQQYTKETIETWIKAENPNRKGGRPPKPS